MKRSYTYLLVLGSIVLMTACSEDFPLDIKGMFSPQGETVDIRFKQSMAYNDSVGEIHLDMQQDDYDVYMCSDSHVMRTRHENLAYFVRQYEAAAAPKLALHLGDLIDAQNNFQCADSVLRLGGRSLQDTIFVTPGNHDIYYFQWPVFRSLFHSSVYWFDTRNGDKPLDLFICLDSAEGELGPDQMNWLRQLLAEKSKVGYRRIILFSHTHLWKLDNSQETTSNYALEATFEFTSLLAQYGVAYYFCGHQHARQDVNYRGVHYLALNATKDTERQTSYAIAHMGEFVDIEHVPYPAR